MRVTRNFIIGLGAILLIGIVLGATLGPALGLPLSESVAGDPIEVPRGHVGDRVVLAHFARAEFSGVDQAWEPAGTEAFGVERLAPTVGADGQLRPAVEVVFNGSTTLLLMVSANAESPQGPQTEHDFVDLETRKSVRTDVRAGDELAVSFFGDWPPATDGFVFQGQTLTPGDELAGFEDALALRPLLAAIVFSLAFPTLLPTPDYMSISPFIANFTAGVEDPQIQSVVAERGVVDGRDAYGVRTTVSFTIPRGTQGDHDDEIALEWDPNLQGGQATFVRTDWVSSEIPYPLATHTVHRLTPPGEKEFVAGESLRSLASFEPGQGDPLDWGQEAPATVQEHSPGTGAPADGSESTLAYPLSLAVRDVESDLTLVPFQAWRLEHPDAALAGAELGRGESSRSDRPVYRWALSFAADGEAFSVSTERSSDVPRARTESAARPQTFDAERAGPVVNQPLTLSAIEKMWRSVASPAYRDQTPDRVLWGVPDDGESRSAACLFPIGHGPNLGAFRDQVVFGYGTGGGCSESSSTLSTSLILVNLTTGQPYQAFEVRRDFERGLPILTSGASPPAQPVETALFSSQAFAPPQIVGAAFATTSLLVLFLVAYFWPALKFTAARLAFFVPGYSKLAKDRLLDHEVRDNLVQAIGETPGIHASELARRVDAGWGTVVHHLGVLERNGLVSSLIEGRHRRYFPIGGVDWSRRGQIAILQHPGTRRAYDLVLAEPGLATTSIARRMGLTTAGAMWHLGRLEKAGLLTRERRGRTTTYRPAVLEVGAVAAVASEAA